MHHYDSMANSLFRRKMQYGKNEDPNLFRHIQIYQYCKYWLDISICMNVYLKYWTASLRGVSSEIMISNHKSPSYFQVKFIPKQNFNFHKLNFNFNFKKPFFNFNKILSKRLLHMLRLYWWSRKEKRVLKASLVRTLTSKLYRLRDNIHMQKR